MQPILNVALKAARRAGDIIIRSLNKLDSIAVSSKDRFDFVTEIDHAAEADIIETIRRNYPDHAILAEETGEHHAGNDDFRWIIDPLDGTLNFIHGFPHFAISIAVECRNRLEYALIFDPIKQEIFSASRGDGAHLNDRRIRVTQRTSFDGALLATGLPTRAMHRLDTYLQTLGAFAAECGDARRAGSAALDLAYVAAGRFDGYWEFGLSPWDIAAGVLLVREAGGMVSDLHGGEDYLKSGDILAANPKLFKKMLQTIKPLV